VWIGAQSDLDAKNVFVAGGSYGGYMSLASMVHFGDRLRGGIDVVASRTSSRSSRAPRPIAATCAARSTATSACRACAPIYRGFRR
jgi:poly(3-hydroxybutyrate) depolymerase